MTEPTDYTDLSYDPAVIPNVRVYATYPAVPFPCPESVSVELHTAGGMTLGSDIRAAVEALANVPAVARAAMAGQP